MKRFLGFIGSTMSNRRHRPFPLMQSCIFDKETKNIKSDAIMCCAVNISPPCISSTDIVIIHVSLPWNFGYRFLSHVICHVVYSSCQLYPLTKHRHSIHTHIVQPQMIVVIEEPGASFLNGVLRRVMVVVM